MKILDPPLDHELTPYRPTDILTIDIISGLPSGKDHYRKKYVLMKASWTSMYGKQQEILTPNFGRYVPRQSEKLARAPERAPGRAWKCGAPERAWSVLSLKMRGSGTSLIRFERENANLRNLRNGDSPWEAMNGLKLKKFWKWWSPERQNPPKM